MSKEEFFREAEQSILSHDKNKAEEVARRGLEAGRSEIFLAKGKYSCHNSLKPPRL